MSDASAAAHDAAYVQRCLQHERRMLAIYRDAAASDARLLQPLANACWRAANFEWKSNSSAEVVQRLWSEGARALAAGWTRRRSGFDSTPMQFALALHLAVAAREADAFTQLAHVEPALRTPPAPDAGTARGFRSLTNHAQGYGLIARAIVTRDIALLASARELLSAALNETDAGWWEEQFPDPLEAAWRYRQHTAECQLLDCIAAQITDATRNAFSSHEAQTTLHAQTFLRTIDEALLSLHTFVAADANHHPKLYLWLPGIALCRLAASSNLPFDQLEARRHGAPEQYAPLPIELLPPIVG